MIKYSVVILLLGMIVASCDNPDFSYPTTFVASDYELLSDRRVSLVTNGGHAPIASPRFNETFEALENGSVDLSYLTFDQMTIIDESTLTVSTLFDGELVTQTVNYTFVNDVIAIADPLGEEADIELLVTDHGIELCLAFYNSVQLSTFQGQTQTFYDSQLGYCRSDQIDSDVVMDSLATLYNPFDTIAFFQVVQRYTEE